MCIRSVVGVIVGIAVSQAARLVVPPGGASAHQPVLTPPSPMVPIAVKKAQPKSRAAARATAGEPMAPVPAFSAEAVGWRLVEDPVAGAQLGVPERLAPHLSRSRSGSRWASTQGQIQIETFRYDEASLPALFEDEKKARRRHVESSALKPDSFVIAGQQGLKFFTVRADARGSEVRGVTVLYDQATAGTMEAVALAVTR